MKKYLTFFVSVLTVFVLVACNLSGNRSAAPSLEGGWRIDSVSLLDTSDSGAAMSVLLFAFAQKDSLPTYVNFGKDSVSVISGADVQQYSYTYKPPTLLLQDSISQEMSVLTLTDSTLELKSHKSMSLHLRRSSSEPAQEASLPK